MHVNTAYFAWSPGFDLVWLSDPGARRSRNLVAHAGAAVAVYDSTQVWGEPDRGDPALRIGPGGNRPGHKRRGFGSIWAQAGPRGAIWRIDPATGRVIAKIPGVSRKPPLLYWGVGGGGLQTVAAGEGAVWTLVRQGVLRIDPGTDRPSAIIRVPGGSDS